jgi:malate/lactate dehydrogenase
MSAAKPVRITLIGAGTIGLSFAALHLTQQEKSEVIIFDTRPDIESYVTSTLPG